MRVLIITNLFPNSREPNRGTFNKQQICELSRLCELKVVAPLSWYYDRNIPKREVIEGIEVFHPRYFMIPKVGRSLYGFYFFLSLLQTVKKIHDDFKFDLIFATWVYPDGFGSYLISKVLKKPIVIKAHGSDINIYMKYFLRKKMIGYALKNSNAIVAVSNALKDKLLEIGVPANKIVIITNGIDSDLFKPMDKSKCREVLGLPLDKKLILFIGNLVAVKGVNILVEAFGNISKRLDSSLMIIGEGNQKIELAEQVTKLKLQDKVVFAGKQPHDKIPLWLNACDIFCLPSLNEGCPNVILEALACGKPVVATNVGGIPELITSAEQGILVPFGDHHALAVALENAMKKNWNKSKQGIISWKENSGELHKVLTTVVNNRVHI